MGNDKKIKDLIEVPPVQTVIRLEECRNNPGDIAGSFVFTSEVAAHFTVLADALYSNRGQGYFLKGDFGSGKSHFLAALYTWLAQSAGAGRLMEGHKGLAKVKTTGLRVLPVDISLVKYRASDSLEQILLPAIDEALISAGVEPAHSVLGGFTAYLRKMLGELLFRRDFSSFLSLPEEELSDWAAGHPGELVKRGIRFVREKGLAVDTGLFGGRYEAFHQIIETVKTAGYSGLFLIIDELSEFFRSKPSPQSLNEDARTLQLLGEISQNSPLWIIAALQESIEKTGDIAQATFRKIKDRFPVRLNLSTVHIRSLIAGRLVHHKPGAGDEIRLIYEESKGSYSTFDATFDEFHRIYPVHPVTIGLLDGLSDLFSRHRGIVDFVYSRVAGDPGRKIAGIMDLRANVLLGPDSIYDHFESRIAEFSSFNIYTGQVVPHLRKVIRQVLDNDDDRLLALRLIKMLILYKIHPTEKTPSVGKLTELAAFSLFIPGADMHVRYISESILDPVAAGSRFLIKEAAPNPVDAVYRISSRENPGRLLEERLDRLKSDMSDDDSRLLLGPLRGLDASFSWPGSRILEEGEVRAVSWISSDRSVFVLFRWEPDKSLIDSLYYKLTEGLYDFAVLFFCKKGPGLSPPGEIPGGIGLWQVTVLPGKLDVLKEYLALEQLREELNPSNPSDAGIVSEAESRFTRTAGPARQAALEIVFSGRFLHPPVPVSGAIRQLKRFDRILESAGDVILEARFPGFKRIAPRRVEPTMRIYKRLLESFVIPGSLSLREARSRGLYPAMEGILMPLGLGELKNAAYIFAPDITGHFFLVYLFSRLKPAAPTGFKQLCRDMKQSEYGVTGELLHFTLAALVHGGLLSIIRNNRKVPADLVDLYSIVEADSVVPGELVCKNDRETLFTECTFLTGTRENESFGLRQQREVWKNIVRWKEKFGRLVKNIESGCSRYTGFSAFRFFDLKGLEGLTNSLECLMDGIKVSYAAKEGIERFLSTYRGSGLTDEDIVFLQKLEKFFRLHGERYTFIYRYLHHGEVKRVCLLNSELNESYNILMDLFTRPEISVIQNEGEELGRLFLHFKEKYINYYSKQHSRYYLAHRRKSLSGEAARGLEVLRRLYSIESLDRPGGITAFLEQLDRPLPSCRKKVVEELLHTPVCSCGFHIDDIPSGREDFDPGERVGGFLEDYVEILKESRIREAVTAHAFALKDAEPGTAGHLKELAAALADRALNPASLLKLFDSITVSRISKVLEGNIPTEERDLGVLMDQLKGRRLTSPGIIGIVKNWIGTLDPETLVAVNSSAPGSSSLSPGGAEWWPYLHNLPESFFAMPGPRKQRDMSEINAYLEQHYPSELLKKLFRQAGPGELLDYIVREKFFFRALHTALLIFAERTLGVPFKWPAPAHVSFLETGGREQAASFLASLEQISRGREAVFPGKLSLRLHYERLYYHSLATAELQKLFFDELSRLEKEGGEWMASLKKRPVIGLEDNPLVLVFDGVSPDVWQSVLPRCMEAGCEIQWYRISSGPFTVDSMASLFNLPDGEADPIEFFEAQGVHYESIAGNSEADFTGALDGYPSTPVIIRIALFDREAHAGSTRLYQMAEMLKTMWRKISGLAAGCRNRPLLITSDHGLTFSKRGLSHGEGGVFELVVPLIGYNSTRES